MVRSYRPAVVLAVPGVGSDGVPHPLPLRRRVRVPNVALVRTLALAVAQHREAHNAHLILIAFLHFIVPSICCEPLVVLSGVAPLEIKTAYSAFVYMIQKILRIVSGRASRSARTAHIWPTPFGITTPGGVFTYPPGLNSLIRVGIPVEQLSFAAKSVTDQETVALIH